MSGWEELTKTALLGTERHAPPALSEPGLLGVLLGQINPADRELALLNAAAALSLHQAAGRLPGKDAAPLAMAAEAETLAPCSAESAKHLRVMLGGEHTELLPEWVEAMRAASKIVSPEMLPKLLDWGRQTPDRRESILPLLGARGKWLAAQNSEWGYVAGDSLDPTVWQTATGEARLLFLRKFRAQSPKEARALVESTWKEETPDDRVKFLNALEASLSMQDEPFLESALDDKRKEVRRAAAELLARLPESRFCQRMIARVKPLLEFTPAEPGKLLALKKARKASLQVTLPEACDKSMARDGIEPKPQSGMGEKAWWLAQLLGFTPVGHWTASWNADPVTIWQAGQATEWVQALLGGWVSATVRAREESWAVCLLPDCLSTDGFAHLEGLMLLLSPARREAAVLDHMRQTKKAFEDPVFLALLDHSGHAWSDAFSGAILDGFRQSVANQTLGWQSRLLMRRVASSVSTNVALAAAAAWPLQSEPWQSASVSINEFLSLLQFRHDMLAEIRKRPEPPNNS